jgi:hypothetical protein
MTSAESASPHAKGEREYCRFGKRNLHRMSWLAPLVNNRVGDRLNLELRHEQRARSTISAPALFQARVAHGAYVDLDGSSGSRSWSRIDFWFDPGRRPVYGPRRNRVPGFRHFAHRVRSVRQGLAELSSLLVSGCGVF